MKRVLIALLIMFFFLPVHPQAGVEPVVPPVIPYDDTPPGLMSEEQLMLEPIIWQLDIPYAGTADPRQRLDLYLPIDSREEAVPVIIFFHGGGWVGGDKAAEAATLMPLLQSGHYAAASVGYRLAPDAQWPAQLHDAKAAIRWIRAHAHIFGLDAGRLALWGRSSGATLALLAAFTADDPQWEGDQGAHTDAGSQVAAVVNYYAVTDMLEMIALPGIFDHTSPDAPEALLLGAPIHNVPQRAFEASPVNHIHPAAPPVLTLHGTDDQIVAFEQARILHDALQQVGVPNYLIPVQDARHGGFPPGAWMRVKDFLDSTLLGKDVWISTLPVHMDQK